MFARFFANFYAPSNAKVESNFRSDSALSFADVLRVAQHMQCATAEFCVSDAPKTKQNLPHVRALKISREFCALSNAEIAKYRCQMQLRLGRELH